MFLDFLEDYLYLKPTVSIVLTNRAVLYSLSEFSYNMVYTKIQTLVNSLHGLMNCEIGELDSCLSYYNKIV